VALGREHPDRFLACLAVLDPPHQADQHDRRANDAPPGGAGGTAGGFTGDGQSRRFKTLTIREARLFSYLREKEPWVPAPPCDAHVVGSEVDTSQRTIRLFIRSEGFPEVAEGEPIPDLRQE
jgi:hypothetical protein